MTTQTKQPNKSKAETKLVNEGVIPKLVELLIYIHKNEPIYFANAGALMHRLKQTWKTLNDQENCPNCKASMIGYIYTFDYHDAKLLISMSEAVRHNLDVKRIPFTTANMVRVNDLPCDYATKSRKTQAAKLGLIAQLYKDKQRVPGVWVITERGFQALRDEPVPKKVQVWRNEIQKRFEDETIRISEIMDSNNDNYTPYEWFEATGPNQGLIF